MVNKKGEVKIGDFGLCRDLGKKGKPLTIKVMTLLYRAVEVLLGAPKYTNKVDMWSMGCILAELLICEPLFITARSPNNIIDLISARCGPSTEETWPGVTALKYYDELFPKKPVNAKGNLKDYIYKKNPK